MAALFPSYDNTLRSPKQSSRTFSRVGALPRQRNVFIIRFVPRTSTISSSLNGSLTFAVKSAERPKFSTKTEELNQYNKKRHIFTGIKYEPIKVSFYDSADGAAQNMWAVYSRFYFGDFNNQSITPNGTNQSFTYDVTLPYFRDFAGQGFGFTAKNGGGDTDAQFFFDHIEIYHFYDGYYDQYNLANPRIASYDPDDLDYSNSEIATINMSFVFEDVNYFQNQPVSGAQFPEFEQAFFGDPVIVPGGQSSSVSAPSISALSSGSYSSIASLLNGTGYIANPLNFRFNGSLTGGGLGLFGNFTFGASVAFGNTNLTTLASGNPALSSALSIGYSPTLGISGATTPSIATGFSGQVADAASATVSSVSSGSSTYNQSVTQAVIAGQAISSAPNSTNNGLALSPASIGVLNSNSTGTSQYGFSTPSSNSSSTLPNPAPQNVYVDDGLA